MGDIDRGISIVIPVYERSAKLTRTLWSITETCDLPYEVIVSEAKQSVAKNRNAGLARVTQDVVFHMDDDVILPPFWASKMLQALMSIPDCGVVAPQMVGPGGEKQNGLADLERDSAVKCAPPGTLFCYRRSDLPGCVFDETYVASQWEDTDFMMQVGECGKSCWAIGAVRIIHDNNWTQADPANWKHNQDYFNGKWSGRLP